MEKESWEQPCHDERTNCVLYAQHAWHDTLTTSCPWQSSRSTKKSYNTGNLHFACFPKHCALPKHLGTRLCGQEKEEENVNLLSVEHKTKLL
mmetsp:Transcript_25603/g.53315  ORF Transcript_25603/g.53315 Transcript_25603/m.53315 type:complete len:92 (-) Transcript_25603:1740-2015(-)